VQKRKTQQLSSKIHTTNYLASESMFLKVNARDDEIAESFQKSETESSLENFAENKFGSHATKAQ
jgi:hypothetical protein